MNGIHHHSLKSTMPRHSIDGAIVNCDFETSSLLSHIFWSTTLSRNGDSEEYTAETKMLHVVQGTRYLYPFLVLGEEFFKT